MKKIIYILLVFSSGAIIAQKTAVSKYGEKIAILNSSQNGLTGNAQNSVELGGSLIKPTVIKTSNANIFEVNSGGTSALPISPLKIVDGTQGIGKKLVSDASGVASWKTQIGIQYSLYKKINASTPVDVIIPVSISFPIPGLPTYTATATGKYIIYFRSYLKDVTNVSAVRQFYFQTIDVNNRGNVSQDETYTYVAAGGYFNSSLSRVISLNAGQTVEFDVFVIRAGFIFESTTAQNNNLEIIFVGK